MKPDGFLLSGRIGRWRWPWALCGTMLTASLVIAIGLVTDPMENWIARLYGQESAGSDLIPGRLDTYANFLFFALSLTLAPALVAVAIHGLHPRHLLGPAGRFQWPLFARASTAMLLVMGLGLAVGLVREPHTFTWQFRSIGHIAWLLLALPVILCQSFAEEYLFKGYLVRIWGAVLPFRSAIMLVIAGLFTSAHAGNSDVEKDLVFNLAFFFAGEILTLAIYLRTRSLGAVTGLHWINNVWAMCVLATEPGQSGAMALMVYSDPILKAGGSRLTDPYSYVEVVCGLTLLWLLLMWRQSPLCLDMNPDDTEASEGPGSQV